MEDGQPARDPLRPGDFGLAGLLSGNESTVTNAGTLVRDRGARTRRANGVRAPRSVEVFGDAVEAVWLYTHPSVVACQQSAFFGVFAIVPRV